MSELISMPFSLTVPDEITALIARAKSRQEQIDNNQALLRTSGPTLCPVCQRGSLNISERGKILGVISDKWLICGNCHAEFDKKLSKAQLIKADKDPYGVFRKHADQTLTMDEWRKIIASRINAENYDYEEEISGIKAKVAANLQQQFKDGKFQFMMVDVGCFLFKENEKPVFGTKAEVIEERKRRVTQRTTAGGRRSYGGFSFRVAKGLYYHTGSSREVVPRQSTVQSSEYTELVSADNGDFVITNQRILFKGNRSRGIAIPIKKVAAVDIDPEQSAIMIVAENRKPAILRLLTTFNAKVEDLDISMSIDLQNVVDFIKA